MSIPDIKLNYDDYYKFKISYGIVLFVIGILGASVLVSIKFDLGANFLTIGFIVYIIMSGFGLISIYEASEKWKKNQELLDEELKLRVDMSKKRLNKELEV